MATVVAIITSIVVANATQTFATPNAAYFAYSLAAGANSAPITPATSRSVLVMGCCTTFYGVGQVSLFHIPSGGMVWTGVESYGTASITQGSSSTAGTHIVFIDNSHAVEIQVASADTIRVHNFFSFAATVNVTLIW